MLDKRWKSEIMMRLRHSGIRWKLRCIVDSSDENTPSSSDENTPPNVLSGSLHGSWRCADGPDDVSSPSGTATPPYLSPEQTKRRSKIVVNSPSTPETPPSSSARTCASLATLPPVILETPLRAPAYTKTSKTHHPRRQGRQKRREAVAPYSRQRSATRPAGAPRESTQSTVDLTPLAQKQASRPGDTFVPARRPHSLPKSN
ncbi:hypothetical protein PHYPSEUDO_011980 [Phytophthora pseudosyringae]|uniref:Uncharacterized protein n=1 Tax=Phytophthora pseudosyringae TaxID=221518 RepID=A0A8T1W961_9STRA|nr:hypothetical protein PHYPSEUDO_011980 [Phytophthora pseudosyringae]